MIQCNMRKEWLVLRKEVNSRDRRYEESVSQSRLQELN